MNLQTQTSKHFMINYNVIFNSHTERRGRQVTIEMSVVGKEIICKEIKIYESLWILNLFVSIRSAINIFEADWNGAVPVLRCAQMAIYLCSGVHRSLYLCSGVHRWLSTWAEVCTGDAFNMCELAISTGEHRYRSTE